MSLAAIAIQLATNTVSSWGSADPYDHILLLAIFRAKNKRLSLERDRLCSSFGR
jgi:hypothetical protein